MTITAPRSTTHRRSATVSLRATISAERLRMLSTRGTFVLATLAVVLPAFFTLTYALTIGQKDGLDPSGPDTVRTVFSSGSSASLLALLLGATAVTTEFRHGTAVNSLLLSGSRAAWMWSKVVVAAVAGLTMTVLGEIAVTVVAMIALTSKGIDVDLADPQMLWTLLGAASLGAFFGVLGVGLGLLIRAQLPLVAGLVVWTTMIEAAILHFVPQVGKFLPGGASASIASDPTLPHMLPVWLSFSILAAWCGAMLLAGNRRLVSSEIAGQQ